MIEPTSIDAADDGITWLASWCLLAFYKFSQQNEVCKNHFYLSVCMYVNKRKRKKKDI